MPAKKALKEVQKEEIEVEETDNYEKLEEDELVKDVDTEYEEDVESSEEKAEPEEVESWGTEE